MKRFHRFWPFVFILGAVLLFFYPIFKGQIPFPGDLLINENPYKSESYKGYAPGGYPNKAQGPDVINQFYPWRYFSINELKNGTIPLWNPHNFSGNPQLANFQTALFYPLNLFYFVLPFNFSWSLIIMLQPLLAGFFMYIFLRKGLGLREYSSVFGSIAFAFSSYMTVWIEYGNIGHVIVWIPLVLFFTKKISESLSFKNFALLVVSLSFSFFAGYIQGVFYLYVLSFLYYLSLNFKKIKIKKIFFFFLALLLPVLIGAIQILPTLELFQSSTRMNYSLEQIEKLLLPVNLLVTSFSADFFGNPATRNYWLDGTYIERVLYLGVPVFIFSLYAIFKVKSKEKIFFAVIGIFTLLISTNFIINKYLYLIPIPVISTTVPTRILSIFIFCFVVVASFGVDRWLNGEKREKLFLLVLVIPLLVWSVIMFFPQIITLNPDFLAVTKRNFILSSLLFAAVILLFYIPKKLSSVAKIGLIAILIFDLFYFFHKITPFSPTEFVYPKTEVVEFLNDKGIDRAWGYGSGYIAPNFQSVDGTFSPEGNDPLHIASYGTLLSSSKDGKYPVEVPRPDANIAPGFGNEDLRSNKSREKILNLLGVKYLINQNYGLKDGDRDGAFPDHYELVYSKNPWQIYENLNSIPRFFMTGSYLVSESETETLSYIYDKTIDLSKTLILDEKPGLRIDINSSSSANLLKYHSDEVSIKTTSDGNKLLFLSDNYFSGWRAYIDGKETKIIKANYTFRAVEVPRGEHVVTFSYFPDSFKKGILVSMGGLLILILSVVILKKYEKRI